LSAAFHTIIFPHTKKTNKKEINDKIISIGTHIMNVKNTGEEIEKI
jgi:hypothetical protein